MGTKRVVLFTAWICLYGQGAMAQNSEKIETDRPGKAQTSYVVAKRILQVETGFEWLKHDKNQQEMQHPEMLIKYGFLKWLELRIRLVSVTDRFQQPSHAQSGIEPVEVGLKALVTEGKGILPHTSFTAQFGIPGFASRDFTADKVFPKFSLNLENECSDKIYLEYNVAAEWDGFDSNPVWILAISPHIEIGKKWQLFVETFSDMQQKKEPEVSVDAGLIYWVSSNIMLDINGGVGVSKAAPKNFADIGFSFRLK